MTCQQFLWYAQDLQVGDKFTYSNRLWTVEWVHPIPPIKKVNLMIRDENDNLLFVLLDNRQAVSISELAE